jgi:gas vesicle protein
MLYPVNLLEEGQAWVSSDDAKPGTEAAWQDMHKKLKEEYSEWMDDEEEEDGEVKGEQTDTWYI